MNPIAICVPVRNEARRLPFFLASIARLETSDLTQPIIFLALDSCSDTSEQVIRTAQNENPLLDLRIVRLAPCDEPNAGRARRAAMQAAYDQFRYWPDARLLTTDADSLLATDWLVKHETAFVTADLIAGYAKRSKRRKDERRDELEVYLERLHHVRRRIDPICYDAQDSHPYTSGASLGITLAAYNKIGGMPALPFGEDAAFVECARLSGLRVRQDKAVRVRTSARRRGRAINGLAAALKASDEDARSGIPFLLENPWDACQHYARQAFSRTAYPRLLSRADALSHAAAADLPPATVVSAWNAASSADAFIMHAVPVASAKEPVTLSVARDLLANIEAQHVMKKSA